MLGDMLETIEGRWIAYGIMWAIIGTLLYFSHIVLDEQTEAQDSDKTGTDGTSI
jgi:hypothetical protein